MNNSEKILFKSIEELNKFFSSPVALNFEALIPIIESVQTQWITPIVSTTELSALIAKYHNTLDTPLSSNETDLLSKIQYPLAQLVFIHAIPLLNLNVTSGGLTVRVSEDSAPASKARTDDLKRQLSINAQRGLDLLLDFLELNADNFLAYKSSEERLDAKSNFVNTTDELNGFLGVYVGKFVLRQMKPVMNRIEEYQIKAILCDDLYDFLKNAIKSRTSLAPYEPLIPLIQRAMSHLTFSVAMDELGVTVDDRGVYISMDKAFSASPTTEESLRGEQARSISRKNEDIGVKALEMLKTELDANASVYPLYLNSSCYQAIKVAITEQTQGSGIFNGL